MRVVAPSGPFLIRVLYLYQYNFPRVVSLEWGLLDDWKARGRSSQNNRHSKEASTHAVDTIMYIYVSKETRLSIMNCVTLNASRKRQPSSQHHPNRWQG